MKRDVPAARDADWSPISPELLRVGGIGGWELELQDNDYILYIEGAFCRHLGISREPIAISWPQYVREHCHPDDQQRILDAVCTYLASDQSEPYYSQHRVWSEEGKEWRWVFAFAGCAERDEDGRCLRLTGCVQDVHDRILAQKELERKQQESLQTIALQKSVLEQQISERTVLLKDIHARVESILDDGIPVAGKGRENFGLLSQETDDYDALCVYFARDLNNAFDIITERMWWYKAIIDSLPVVVSVLDVEGNWIYLNRPARELVQQAGHEPVLGNKAIVWGPETGTQITDSKDLGEGRISFSIFNPQARKFYQGQTSHLLGRNGSVAGNIRTMLDVTEVHDADERTRIMFEAVPICCAIWSSDLEIVDCNPESIRIFGLSDKEEFRQRFFFLSPEYQPDGQPSLEVGQALIRSAFSSGYEHFEWVHETSVGEALPMDVTLVRVDWRGEYVVVAYMRDLRELKATQTSLDKERMLLRQILDSSPVCFVIIVDGIIRFTSPFTTSFLGAKVGDEFGKFFKDSQAVDLLEEELRRTGAVNWRLISMRGADGSTKEMLANIFYAEYYGEEGIMAWLMDVTEMREKEKELLLARDAAEESTRSKSEFLANMSHEIRTPMNAILGMTHLILQTDLTPKQRNYMIKSEQASKSLLRIINDILDFSKIEAGKMDMEESEFSLEKMMRGVADIVRNQCREKGLDFHLVLPPHLPVALRGDSLRLRQILVNLTSNAVKFTDSGSISIAVELEKQTEDTITLLFRVADTGIGLSEEQAAKLFSPFSQADASITRKYGGTGLGLAICRQLVSLMNGDIWITSVLGRGSEFAFTVKLEACGEEQMLTSLMEGFSDMWVLVAGDTPQGREFLRLTLQSFGCSVVVAASPQEMASQLDGRDGSRFCFVLMDWQEPVESAREAIRLCKDTGGPLPPFLLLAEAGVCVESAELDELDIADYIMKPASASSLFDALQSYRKGSAQDGQADSGTEEASSLKGARILLVEDNEINQLVAKDLLEIAGMEVTIAGNGLEALALLQPGRFDLVLMDIQMPEMDGLSATETIRKQPHFMDLPILAMTAHAMSGDREKSLAAGMNDHVTKPIDAMELYEAIAKWIKPRNIAA